jgi:hypothetical protein
MRNLLLVGCLMLAACSGGAPESATANSTPAAQEKATAPAAPPAVAEATPEAAAPASSPAPGAAAAAAAPEAAAPVAAPATGPASAPIAGQPTVPVPDAARRPPEELLTRDGVYYGCKTDSDCQVKDVGNCCGYYPACVNKDSPTFPEQVKAKCSAEGMSSICGFQEISGCSCVEGRCASLSGPGGAVQ